MNTLPPLPFVDGALILDNSTIELLKCPRLLELKWLRSRVPVSDRAGANFGSTIHRGLEVRYKLYGTKPVNNTMRYDIDLAMNEWQQEHPQPEGDFRNYDHALKMMTAYLENYPSETFKILEHSGKPIIENSFLLPFGVEISGHPLYYSGKIDLGIRDQNGIWSFDHKTAFQFGEAFNQQMNMDGGQLGYCWALGEVMAERPQGYIIDAIRVRRPTKKKSQSEDYGMASCIDATDFFRKPVWVTDDMIEEWRQDVITLVGNIFDYHAKGYFPRHRWNCTNKYGACDMYEVCSCPRVQRDGLLAGPMFEDNTWTPLKNHKK
jgi:hypothetical protein